MDVVETMVTHPCDVLRFVDAGSRPDDDNRARVSVPLHVEVTHGPSDLSLMHKLGQSVLWRHQPDRFAAVYDGEASASERQRPGDRTFRLRGNISDPSRRYHPRAFDVRAGDLTKPDIVLYRSLLGTPLPRGGAVEGNVRFSASRPASWAVIELDVVPVGTDPAAPLRFWAQANLDGDFRLPLTRLPADPTEIDNPGHPPRFRVRASSRLSGRDMPRLERLEAVTVGHPGRDEQVAEFAPPLVPGTVLRLHSHATASSDQPYLRVVAT